MSSLFETAAGIARDAVGPVFCAAGGLQRAGLDLVDRATGGYAPIGLPRAVQRGLESFCPLPPGEIPLPESPFLGGQCDGVIYNVQLEVTDKGRFNCNERTRVIGRLLEGPIRTIQQRPVDIPIDCNPGQMGSNGLSGSWGDVPGQRDIYTPGRANDVTISFQILSIAREDGLTDECGDPPPVFPPGTPTPTNPFLPGIDINIDLPDIGPTNITFAPTVGPIYIDANLGVYAPVNVEVTGPSINVDFNFEINLTDPTKPPRPIPPPPRTPDGRPNPPNCPPVAPCLPVPDEDEPDGPSPPDLDDDEREVSGVVVTSLVTDGVRGLTEVGQGILPFLLLPRVATLRFRYRREDGSASFGQDIDIKEDEVVVPAPKTGLKCIGAAVFPRLGVECDLTLIFKPVGSCN